MKSQKVTIIIAVVVAAAAGLLSYNYLASASGSTIAVATRPVVVAATDIPARATINAKMLRVVNRPVDDVERDAIGESKSAVGYLALTSIPQGAVIATSRVGKPDDLPLPVRLKAGMRALTIPIDSVRGVAGLIEPGDHVDVIAVMNKNLGSNAQSNVRTALHDVLVLAMGTALEQQNNPQTTESPNATTVTLALTPRQAELLTLADSVATLRLALRPPGDKANRAQDGFSLPQTTSGSELTEAPAAEAPAPALAAPPAQPAAPPAQVQRTVQAAPTATSKPTPREIVVTVIDGDKVVGSGK